MRYRAARWALVPVRMTVVLAFHRSMIWAEPEKVSLGLLDEDTEETAERRPWTSSASDRAVDFHTQIRARSFRRSWASLDVGGEAPPPLRLVTASMLGTEKWHERSAWEQSSKSWVGF